MTVGRNDPRLARSQKRFDELNEIIAWATREKEWLICELYRIAPKLCTQSVLAEMNNMSQPGVGKIINRHEQA